ncbi:kelch repeat protein [Colletotrichum fioriniae PJ7]|uniref:Kelch repeat protein n=1 Tax=Colletotrichum fioriniae PJ7 TaxID=1445577 RepID=A0A010QWA1_9PEZI|nr:kelch repeat protein [Colletotrichum fioriniae PJ7]
MLFRYFRRNAHLLLGIRFLLEVHAWELSDVPAPDLFLRRGLSNVAVIGNFLYIDGGEVSQLDAEGKPYTFFDYESGNVVNSTLSIDLSESWSPANVSIREIPKEPYGMDRQALWERADNDSFYIWGGHTANTLYLKDESLATGIWKFQADGSGGGQWTKETPVNPTEFTELVRSEDGAFASTPHGCFWFGGWAGTRTKVSATNGDADLAPAGATPGMVVYDWNTNQWSNKTAALRNAFPPYGTVRGARALYVPDFGPNGIIVLLGGFMATLEPIVSGSDSLYQWMDISNITFMDPVSKKWYSQTTTGSAPTRRQWFCMVGLKSETTYEIAYSDVFVLSLPGFVWRQVQFDDVSPRTDHHCAVVGNRKMIVVGGRTTSKSAANLEGWALRDPWPQGLGLFDLAEWTWKNEYNASAGAYRSHEEIQRWYREKGVSSVSWSSEEVKTFFVPTAKITAIPTGTPTAPPTAMPRAKEASSNAIAGAAIVAVILAVLAFLAIMWIDGRSERPIIVPLPPIDKTSPKDDTVDVPLQTEELEADPSFCIDEPNSDSKTITELPVATATDPRPYRDEPSKDTTLRTELPVALVASVVDPNPYQDEPITKRTSRTELPVGSAADYRSCPAELNTDPTTRTELPVDSVAGNQYNHPVELDALYSPARL